MMKECKYNDFTIRILDKESEAKVKYDLCICETDLRNVEFSIFERSKNQIVFTCNQYNVYLGNFEKYILVRKGVELNLLWTSFKGNPIIYEMKSERSFYDYLIMNFSQKKQNILYLGNNVNAPMAAWRNAVNMDSIGKVDVDLYLKKTQETYLPF